MNLQHGRWKGHNDSKDFGPDVEHTHLYLQSKGHQQQLRPVLHIGIHPWCH